MLTGMSLGRQEMAITSLQDILRWMVGRDKKPKSAFATEQEAAEFCDRVYKETGGVTPELRRAYDFFLNNYDDDCPPGHSQR